MCRCGNPAGQVQEVIKYLAGFNITNNSKYGPPHSFGKLWFDIEGAAYWNKDKTANVHFLEAYGTCSYGVPGTGTGVCVCVCSEPCALRHGQVLWCATFALAVAG